MPVASLLVRRVQHWVIIEVDTEQRLQFRHGTALHIRYPRVRGQFLKFLGKGGHGIPRQFPIDRVPRLGERPNKIKADHHGPHRPHQGQAHAGSDEASAQGPGQSPLFLNFHPLDQLRVDMAQRLQRPLLVHHKYPS